MKRNDLEAFFTELLTPHDYPDYGPNGLQIEGKEEIKKIAFAVSATQDSVQQAIELKADALVVHHGLFWKFHGVRTITGPFGQRVIPLIKNQINLFGYHLPLDGHPQIGNAAMIAKQLDLIECQEFGEYKRAPIGIQGRFQVPITEQELTTKIKHLFNKDIITASVDPQRQLSSIGIITGGANGGWLDAYNHGLDAYLTGEMSEHDWHDAKEYGISMFAAGHHATERLGILALKERVQQAFPQIEGCYIELNNPA